VASLRLAVLVIILIAIISAWGTIVESKYNSEIALKVVYHSKLMYGVLALLVVILVAVIIDRFPWKRHHLGFMSAHMGIIILLFGSLWTKIQGIDGSMVLGIGETSNRIILPNTDVLVYASFDGEQTAKVFEQGVDFYLDPPSQDKPLTISLSDGEKMEVIEYIPFAIVEQKVKESSREQAQKAIRFQLQNSFTSVTEWVLARRGGTQSLPFGPAQVVLTDVAYQPTGANEIVLMPQKDGDSLHYQIFSKDKKYKTLQGVVRPGDAIDTPWMGMKFRLLKYLKGAEKELSYQSVPYPRNNTVSLVKVRFGEHEELVPLDAVVKFFGQKAAYYFGYRHRRLQLDFSMTLKDFQVGRYQGTQQAMSYQSEVFVPGQGDVTISMNEPLKYRGFTFYQASFQSDEQGKPTVSVLSVNWDPGRWLKYLGSALIVLGAIIMFYLRKLGYYKRSKVNEST
jgi:hypothetical protein